MIVSDQFGLELETITLGNNAANIVAVFPALARVNRREGKTIAFWLSAQNMLGTAQPSIAISVAITAPILTVERVVMLVTTRKIIEDDKTGRYSFEAIAFALSCTIPAVFRFKNKAPSRVERARNVIPPSKA